MKQKKNQSLFALKAHLKQFVKVKIDKSIKTMSTQGRIKTKWVKINTLCKNYVKTEQNRTKF
jgi:hypothetical protein